MDNQSWPIITILPSGDHRTPSALNEARRANFAQQLRPVLGVGSIRHAQLLKKPWFVKFGDAVRSVTSSDLISQHGKFTATLCYFVIMTDNFSNCCNNMYPHYSTFWVVFSSIWNTRKHQICSLQVELVTLNLDDNNFELWSFDGDELINCKHLEVFTARNSRINTFPEKGLFRRNQRLRVVDLSGNK